MSDVLVKPAFQSTYPDTGDTTKLGPTAWNAPRLFSGGNDGELLIRRTAAGTGAAWEPWAYFKPPVFASWFPYRISPDPTTGDPTVYNTNGSAFDVSQLAPAIGTTYYVSNSATNGYAVGNAGNNGLSKSTPKALMTEALALAVSGDAILINPGTYSKDESGMTITGGKTLTIKGDGGFAVLSSHALPTLLTWTLTSGATATYQTTRSATISVWDASVLDSNGDYTRLVPAGAFGGTGDLTAGQSFVSGSTVYVRTSDSRNLTIAGNNATVRVMVSQNLFSATGANTVYVEQLDLQGGTNPAIVANNSATPARLYMKNCRVRYGGSGNGLSATGAITVVQDSLAAQNFHDGFNYHIGANSVPCQSLEINNTGRDNGFAGDNINNGSTTHDGNAIVRVGGQYYRNNGPNVVDVGTSTVSWSVGVGAWGSTAVASIQNANFQSQATGGMWLDSCWGGQTDTVTGKYQFVVSVAAGAALRFRAFNGDLAFSQDSGTILRAY